MKTVKKLILIIQVGIMLIQLLPSKENAISQILLNSSTRFKFNN